MNEHVNELMNVRKDHAMWIMKRFRDGRTYYQLTDRPTNQQTCMTGYRDI